MFSNKESDSSYIPDIPFSDNDSDNELMSKVRFIISNPAIFISALWFVLYIYKKRLDSLETELEYVRNKLEGKKIIREAECEGETTTYSFSSVISDLTRENRISAQTIFTFCWGT